MLPGLGTQLRHLIELLDGAVEEAYASAGLRYRPRFTPIVRALMACEPSTIGQIAEAAKITQPAATQTVTLMIKEGLLASEPGPVDGRQRLVRLSPRGRAMLPRLNECWQITQMAADSLDASLSRPLSQSLDEAIAALGTKSFNHRMAEARTQLSGAESPSSKSTLRKRPTGAGKNDAKKKRTRAA
ncbi:MarR family winged helix-turn-helix transcriptional regulator [Dyella choica]|uniref:MarR family transcriptional regulator n=1 Tax=Dyella choica TaxID=1927959 RepID=A0A432M7P1_9GAMM|nr:MarR family transcriptional regulator [Dyella choica]RUL77511.1 MarR family transcriptional regulator [Dyella choica]